MIPELSHIALIIALCLAGLMVALPIMGLYRKNPLWMQAARPLALGQSFFICLSFTGLLYAFLNDDFSVAYVAEHSNTALPLLYKTSAIWGGHEGSLLLWVLILSAWIVLFSLCSRSLPMYFATRTLVILGAISVGFLLFLLSVSNPFIRFLPEYPVDGRDLNPLLQDIGFILHPPLLYIGYVGFAVPFALAIGALWTDEVPGETVAKWMRPWALSAFAFLTVGIALGSWWAYYELGWGGWWFWDPVENASFIPWLVAIALIHQLIVTNQRKLFQAWTFLVAIMVFALSLLGTFLVRSGLLTSVHAFASDPTRGIFLLEFICVIVGGALLLYARNVNRFSMREKINLNSREALIVFSTILIIVSTGAVLLGTLFPLAYNALTNEPLSVGAPYFNAVLIPFMLPVCLLIPLGPLSQWGYTTFKTLRLKILLLSLIAFLGAVFCYQFIPPPQASGWVIVGLGIGFWIALGTLQHAARKIRLNGIKGVSLPAWGMLSAHFGMAVFVIGITGASHYAIEREVAIPVDQSITLGDDRVVFRAIHSVEGTNYIGYRGHFEVFRQAKKIADLYPEKRIFVAQGHKITETAIYPGLLRDIYISLGDRIKERVWSARIYYKPCVRWIWLGAIMMALGALMASIGRRYRG